MRKNAEKVLMAFAERKACNGGTIHTNGTELFSYNMKIAQINAKEGVDILDYNQAPSATTRSHIRACVNFFAAATIDSRPRSF